MKVLINVLDKKERSVLFKQVLESEVGSKYTLVKGENDLYELSQPSCTEANKKSREEIDEKFREFMGKVKRNPDLSKGPEHFSKYTITNT